MNPEDRPDTQTSNRRRAPRRGTAGSVRVQIESTTLAGELDNVSKTGVLFYTDADLRVQVEVEEDGVTTSRKGRLVRLQRMREDHVGWAVEFE